jgi:hypothetical protein
MKADFKFFFQSKIKMEKALFAFFHWPTFFIKSKLLSVEDDREKKRIES